MTFGFIFKSNSSFLFRSDWYYSYRYKNNIDKKLENDICLNKKNLKIYPGPTDKLFFISRRKVRPGWYLFGIKHYSENRIVFGTLRSGKFGAPQGRPMYSSRIRWRVFRVRNQANVELTLEGINKQIFIDKLVLIPLFQFDAFRRIKRRIKKARLINNKNRNFIFAPRDWKIYNKFLLSQKNNYTFLTYSRWQSKFEVDFKEFFKKGLNNKFQVNKTFDIQYDSNLNKNNQADFIVIISEGGFLSNIALEMFSYFLNTCKEPKVIYPDEDFITPQGKRHSPNFKPSWNRELFWVNPNFSKCWVIEKEIWNKSIESLKRDKIKLNLKSVLLEIINYLEFHEQEKLIYHLPFICYHTTSKEDEIIKEKINFNESKLIEYFINKLSTRGDQTVTVKPNREKVGYSLSWSVPKETLLSILIPTRDSLFLIKNCLNSINSFEPGCKIEIIIIDNDSKNLETLKYFDSLNFNKQGIQTKIIRIPGEFNYSALNNKASKYASGEILLLLNNDVEFIKPLWGLKLIENALRTDIACVGAMLVYDDFTIQHAGVVLGLGEVAGHSHKYFNLNSPGYMNRLYFQQEYSAVTAACLAISKRKWDLLGGLDAVNLKVNYNDVDLCLRAREKGFRNIFIPEVVAIHHESKSRGKPEGLALLQWKKEKSFMKKKWGAILLNDPAYNPNLTLLEENFSLWEPSNESIKLRNGSLR